MQHQPDNEKKKKPWYRPKRLMDYTRRSEYVAQGASIGLSALERFIPAIERLQSNLGFLSLFITILGLPFHLFNIMYGLAWSKESDLSRATRVLIGFGGIILTSIGIVAAVGLISVAAPILMMVGAAKGLVESVWRTGLSVYERFFGQGAKDAKEIKHLRETIKQQWPATETQFQRLTELTNKQRKRNGQIANNLHVIAMNVVGTIAVGLLFSGVTSAAGVGILVGVGVYGAVDAVGLNPFKWAGRLANWTSQKIRGKPLFSPFTPKNTDELKAELYHELTKKNPVAAKIQQPVASVAPTANSEKQILSELQKKPTRPAPLPEHDKVNQPDPAHPSSAYFAKTSVAIRASGNLKQTPLKQSEEDEAEGEGEHPHFKNHK